MSTGPYREKSECDKRHKEVVTVEQCKIQHHSSLRQLTAISSGLVLLVVVIGWAIVRADIASAKASEVRRRLDVHEARQIEVTKSVLKTLDRIELELKEQGKLIEQIHRNGSP